jgi:voltage-gated potassium channel Kch
MTRTGPDVRARADRIARRRARRREASRTWARPAVAVCLITGGYFILPLRLADLADGQLLLRGTGLLACLGALTWLVGRQVRRAMDPDRRVGERLAMLVTLVDIVVVAFAVIYVTLAEQFVGIETRMDALYFSVTTLTTVGYGDISAAGQAARAIVTVQMFFDLIIVTSAISLVIGAVTPGRSSPPDEPDGPSA